MEKLPGLTVLEADLESLRIRLVGEGLDLRVENLNGRAVQWLDKVLTIFDLPVALRTENHGDATPAMEPTIYKVGLYICSVWPSNDS